MKKCCGPDELLDAETLKCLPKTRVPPERMAHFLPSYMLDDNSNLITMHLKVQKDIQTGQMVNCQTATMELIDLTKPLEYLISTQGKLVSAAGKYTPELDLGDFCIDTAFLRQGLLYNWTKHFNGFYFLTILYGAPSGPTYILWVVVSWLING